MNFIDRIMNKITKTSDEPDLTPEELKAQRIQFHREKVRNGPANFTYWTAGQQRRAQARAAKSQHRKLNQRHRRNFKTGELDRAILRGQLQAIGALPYATDFKPTVQMSISASTWLVANFAPRNEQSEIIFDDETLTRAVENAMSVLRTGAAPKAKV